MRALPFVALLSFCALAGCGGSGGSGGPAGPAPTPTTTGITLTLRDTVLVGATATGTAAATLSNGQTAPVTSGWRSDTPTVATATSAGAVTGVANGEATIVVASGGHEASKRIRVAPSYDGQWHGNQLITSCAATGEAAGACEAGGGVIGALFPIALTGRHPADLQVSGEFSIETLLFPTFSSSVEDDGTLRFSSSTVTDGVLIEASWVINSSEAGRATGTIRERYSAPGVVVGDIVYESTLSSFARSTAVSRTELTAGHGRRVRSLAERIRRR